MSLLFLFLAGIAAPAHADLNEALNLSDKGKYDESITKLVEAAKTASKDEREEIEDELLEIALSAGEDGKSDVDLRGCDEAVRLFPNSARAHTARGRTLQYLFKRYEEAEKEYREAIRLEPTDDDPYGYLVGILGHFGRHEERIALLKTELEKAKPPKHLAAVSYSAMADSAVALGRHKEAVGYWKKALELNPKYFRGQKEKEKRYKESLAKVKALK